MEIVFPMPPSHAAVFALDDVSVLCVIAQSTICNFTTPKGDAAKHGANKQRNATKHTKLYNWNECAFERNTWNMSTDVRNELEPQAATSAKVNR